MKNVLVLYYSQSGQLRDIAHSISHALESNAQIQVSYYEIQMQKPYPFPWDRDTFFDVFPETFQQIPEEIMAPSEDILSTRYDLVLLHYQVWYLTPSIPINSFLKSKYAATILKNTPVLTISGSRNMWVMAQEKVKKMLLDHEAKLVGNIALVDRNINLVSVVTIVDWLFSGQKKKAYGIFPLPGVSNQEIQNASRFGNMIWAHLEKNNFEGLQEALIQEKAVEIRHFLVSMDKKGNRMFALWSQLILKHASKRKSLLRLFYVYLFAAIWIISPLVHLIETLLYPVLYFKIQKEKKYYQGISQP